MAVDAMDIDNSPASTPEVERKRKHKKQDASSPTKKRKQTTTTDSKSKSKSKDASTTLDSSPESPFSLTKATLYLPIAPISISTTHAQNSLLAEHLSPLLLTYFPPLKGVVLAYSQPSMSSFPPSRSQPKPSSTDPNPLQLTAAKTAEEYGVMYVYLTATFLVFRPRRGQTLEGWVNVQSEGFLGAVVFNLFSVGIERKRLPSNWKWVPPGEEVATDAEASKDATTTDDEASSGEKPFFDAAKEHFQPAALVDELDLGGEEEEEASGHFQSVSGHQVRGNVQFRVVDVDVVPGSDRDRGFLSIEGTMLEPEQEEKLALAEFQGTSVPAAIFSGSGAGSSSNKFNRVIPISAGPEVVDVVDVEAEPTEEAGEPVKAEKKEKKKKSEKSEKKEKKEKTEKKEKKSKKEKK